MAVGQNLKRVLTEKKIKVTELAEKTGISTNTLYAIIKRDSLNISYDNLINICEALRISPVELLPHDTEEDISASLKWFEGQQFLDAFYYELARLNQFGLEKVMEYISLLVLDEKYTTRDINKLKNYCDITDYQETKEMIHKYYPLAEADNGKE